MNHSELDERNGDHDEQVAADENASVRPLDNELEAGSDCQRGEEANGQRAVRDHDQVIRLELIVIRAAINDGDGDSGLIALLIVVDCNSLLSHSHLLH